jgi:hypothetical protein
MSDLSRGLASTATTQQQNSFLALTVLTGPLGSPPRARKFETAADAGLYDSDRVILSDLADVTNVTATTSSIGAGTAGRDSFGWAVKYKSVDEKTATGATLLNSCVVWSSITPTGGSTACGSGRGAQSAFFQGDAFSGAPNCASGFLAADQVTYVRSKTLDVISPPAGATPIIALDPKGRSIHYSALQIQPSNSSSVNQVDVGASNDLLKLINSIPLTADQHICRHSDSTQCP